MKIENLEKGFKKFSNILNFVFTNRSDLYIIIEYEIERFLYAPLAQLDRVAHYECEGWGFESLMAHQITKKHSSKGECFFVYTHKIRRGSNLQGHERNSNVL